MVSASRTKVLQALLAAVSGVFGVACQRHADGKTAFASDATRPDVLPVMLNKELPFHYPPALYAEKAQGNVTLRLYVDKDGIIVNDSTHVVQSSNVPALDSAAIKGAHDLRFVPAKSHGIPMPVSILFPVYFRHPEAPPPPGDTLLRKVAPPGTGPLKP